MTEFDEIDGIRTLQRDAAGAMGAIAVTQVFVSHASVDKHSRIRPLVHALLLEGVSLWVDRPGFGPSHLGFDTDFIRRHGIGFLKPGRRYQEQIRQALKHSSFVLACLSRGFLDDRDGQRKRRHALPLEIGVLLPLERVVARA